MGHVLMHTCTLFYGVLLSGSVDVRSLTRAMFSLCGWRMRKAALTMCSGVSRTLTVFAATRATRARDTRTIRLPAACSNYHQSYSTMPTSTEPDNRLRPPPRSFVPWPFAWKETFNLEVELIAVNGMGVGWIADVDLLAS